MRDFENDIVSYSEGAGTGEFCGYIPQINTKPSKFGVSGTRFDDSELCCTARPFRILDHIFPVLSLITCRLARLALLFPVAIAMRSPHPILNLYQCIPTTKPNALVVSCALCNKVKVNYNLLSRIHSVLQD